MVKPPAKITVGPHVYTVEVSAKRANDASVRYAQVDHATLDIIVNPDQHPSQMADSVLHELLHALCDMQGVAVGDKPLIEPAAEEPLVRGMAPLLLDLLRRNPALVTWLTDAA